MNYELAKKLKDAGFVTHNHDIWTHCVANCFTHSNSEEVTHCPSLSELIEACGDRFGAIYKAHDNITIEGEGDKITCENVYEAVDSITFSMMTSPKFPKSFLVNEGSTPEIAVANLWLQLNSQPK
jgi:hypothetical protein